MSYTIIADAKDGPVATVAPSVLDALLLARGFSSDTGGEITIAGEDGWILTLEELEALAKP